MFARAIQSLAVLAVVSISAARSRAADFNWLGACYSNEWYCCIVVGDPPDCTATSNWMILDICICPPFPTPSSSVDLAGNSVILSFNAAAVLSLETSGRFDILGADFSAGFLHNSGTLTLNGANLNAGAMLNEDTFQMHGGLLSGGEITNLHSIEWFDSAVAAADLRNFSTIEIQGASNSISGTLNNEATLSHQSASTRLTFQGGTLNNDDLYNLRGDIGGS